MRTSFLVHLLLQTPVLICGKILGGESCLYCGTCQQSIQLRVKIHFGSVKDPRRARQVVAE
jgi:hypothetical protein